MSAPETNAAGTTGADAAVPAVRMREVNKAFGDNVVLDQLHLDVDPGERVVIIGPSGSGKTTILRVIMTLERPDSGTIEVGGRHLYHERKGDELKPASEKHIRQVRANVGMVFQHFNLFPHLSALENIALAPIKAQGRSKDDANQTALELLDKVGLREHANHTPGQLSGGQKQRVAIARSLATEPEVMLFDEVTSALDPELVGDVLEVLRDIAEEGKTTMMLVTHEMGFAREVADRLVMFDSGRIIEEGRPREILADPQHERTQSFLKAVLAH